MSNRVSIHDGRRWHQAAYPGSPITFCGKASGSVELDGPPPPHLTRCAECQHVAREIDSLAGTTKE